MGIYQEAAGDFSMGCVSLPDGNFMVQAIEPMKNSGSFPSSFGSTKVVEIPAVFFLHPGKYPKGRGKAFEPNLHFWLPSVHFRWCKQ